MFSKRFITTSFLAGVFAIAPALGQDIISARAGLINLAEGTVLMNGEEVHQGDRYEVMKEGDTLSTEKGRAEVLLNVGTFLRLGEDSSFHLDSGSLEDVRLTLLSGSAIVESAEFSKENSVEVTVEGKTIALRKRGLYEFQAGEDARVRTYDGELALKEPNGDVVKITKEREVNLGGTSLVATKFDGDDTTPLYRWGARRARTLAQASRSSATTYTSRSTGGLTLIPGMRGGWIFNPLFGYYTYLPFSGYGYSPYNLIIVSPRTVNQPVYRPGSSGSGFDMGVGLGRTASAPAYSGGSTGSGISGSVVSAPAPSAPAMASPNTGGGAAAGHRR
jgi:hypothetical protein